MNGMVKIIYYGDNAPFTPFLASEQKGGVRWTQSLRFRNTQSLVALTLRLSPGADPEILVRSVLSSRGTLYVGHHYWKKKKILGLRWSKNIKITLETISFWQNISFSIFNFSIFIYNERFPMKSDQFAKLTNALIRRKKKTLIHQLMKK